MTAVRSRQPQTCAADPCASHLYFHVPFCSGKCAYCAFYSLPFNSAAARQYLAALETEMQLTLGMTERLHPLTLYVGGGTPSILATPLLDALLGTVRRHVRLDRLEEWTIEANPGTLDDAALRLLRRRGVTRISLGAQSFDDDCLSRLGRRHDAAAVRESVARIRAHGGFRVSLDLIAALPGVGAAQWRRTLRKAIALRPDHLSVYCLTLEPGTRLQRAARRGAWTPPTDDEELRALATAERLLGEAGYGRYEISNYALPGRECRHNLAFWRGGDYLGFGPAASSRSGLARWTNCPDLAAYSTALQRGRLPPRTGERLTEPRDDAERLAFAFRLAEGAAPLPCSHGALARRSFRAKTALSPCNPFPATLSRLRRAGLLRRRNNRWVPTRRGRDLADTIAAEILDSVP